jgi:hypothetical protein
MTTNISTQTELVNELHTILDREITRLRQCTSFHGQHDLVGVGAYALLIDRLLAAFPETFARLDRAAEDRLVAFVLGIIAGQPTDGLDPALSWAVGNLLSGLLDARSALLHEALGMLPSEEHA